MTTTRSPHQHGKFFPVFLIIYTIMIVSHMTHMMHEGVQCTMLISLILGLLFSIIAHYKHHNYWTAIFLLAHISIEYVYLFKNTQTMTIYQVILGGVHGVFDIVFLFEELKNYLQKYKKQLAVVLGIVLASYLVKMITFVSFIEQGSHTHHHSEIDMMIVGGTLGCLGMILFNYFSQKKSPQEKG